MIALNQKQLETIVKLSRGYGVRLDLYESDEGGEIVVHVLGRLGYGVDFVRLDGTLVGSERANA